MYFVWHRENDPSDGRVDSTIPDDEIFDSLGIVGNFLGLISV